MMSVDPGIVDLINAEIDGEISAEDRAVLEEHLAGDSEAKAYQLQLSTLCSELDAVECMDPPPHLKHVILDTIPRARAPRADSSGNWRAWLSNLVGGGVMRYAMSFAAGAVLTITLIGSDQISRQAADDISSLVGTISRPDQFAATGERSDGNSIRLDQNEIAGSVHLSSSGPIMIIDFDLASPGPIEIVTSFADRDTWFNGFNQLEGGAMTIAADEGSVTVRTEGQRRFALYLNNASQTTATIGLRFYSGRVLIHEDELKYGEIN